MRYLFRRFGFSISRGWTLLLLALAALIGAAFLVGPLRPMPAELELLVIAGDVALPFAAATAERDENGDVRFAVPLAVRNIGARPARPHRLLLDVPARLRVATERGPITGDATAGVPLRRYIIDLPAPLLRPNPATERLPGLDTIWLEPDLATYYCSLRDELVPEFMPAPAHDPATLADVRIFYSLETEDARERHTGVLGVELDAGLLRTESAPMPPSFTTEFARHQAELPELPPLRAYGTRTAHCGDPEEPIELYTVTWETDAGGRFHVVYVHGEPRKHLYDLNGDSIIELETWDVDSDGRMEARREARFAVPEFLLPEPPRHARMVQPDTVRPDSAWLALFHNADAGPWRFIRPPRTDTAAADTLAAGADTLAAGTDTVTVAGPFGPISPADTAGVRPPTPEWLELFEDTAAGPFRFSRRAQPADTTGAPADTAAADTTAADTAAPPPQPRPRRRAPLGTPVPYPPPGR